VLVQPHADAGVETLVGATRDDAFGPVVTVGSGGVAVELHDDAAVRLAPLSNADARDAIAATTLAEQLGGYRGDPPRDVEALADLLEEVGRLAAAVNDVAELDLKPGRRPRGRRLRRGRACPDELTRTRRPKEGTPASVREQRRPRDLPGVGLFERLVDVEQVELGVDEVLVGGTSRPAHRGTRARAGDTTGRSARLR